MKVCFTILAIETMRFLGTKTLIFPCFCDSRKEQINAT
jgi:hypothetical protein